MPGVSRSNRTARDYLRITPADVPCSLKPTHASNLKCVIPVHVRTESRGATMSGDRRERRMNWAMASKIRGAMTRTAVAATLVGMAFAGAVVPASADNAPTGPIPRALRTRRTRCAWAVHTTPRWRRHLRHLQRTHLAVCRGILARCIQTSALCIQTSARCIRTWAGCIRAWAGCPGTSNSASGLPAATRTNRCRTQRGCGRGAATPSRRSPVGRRTPRVRH